MEAKIREKLNKKGYVTEDFITKAIGKESIDYIKKISIRWLVISMLIFYAADLLKIDTYACELCGYLSNKISFIEIFANQSSFPNGMRAQWLFLFFTMPLYFYLYTKNIKQFKHGEMSKRVPIGSIIIIAVFIVAFSFTDAETKEKSSGGIMSYLSDHHYLVSPILSCIVFCVVTALVYFTYAYFKAYIEYLRSRIK